MYLLTLKSYVCRSFLVLRNGQPFIAGSFPSLNATSHRLTWHDITISINYLYIRKSLEPWLEALPIFMPNFHCCLLSLASGRANSKYLVNVLQASHVITKIMNETNITLSLAWIKLWKVRDMFHKSKRMATLLYCSPNTKNKPLIQAANNI